MIEHAAPRSPSLRTKTGIPIRNLWYMMLYVWDAAQLKEAWRADVESAPTFDALLTSILRNLIQQRLRIGLGRDYRNDEAEIAGIRGRVAFAESVKRMSFQHGRAHCRFQTFSANVPKNQIVRSTLARLVALGEFGADQSNANEMRAKLRRLIRDMDMVDVIGLKPSTIRREQLNRHDPDYALMLAICGLILQRQMPQESAGAVKLPRLDRDALTLWDVYEKFVARFYSHHLKQWYVGAQQHLDWPAETTSEYLPGMTPDLLLQYIPSGALAVLDTKFYAECVVRSQYGDKLKFHSSHLFQIYAYLMSQEDRSPHHKTATGILLYPTVTRSMSEVVRLQGHDIRWETIDLSQPWEHIESDLLAIPQSVLASEDLQN